MKRLTSFLFWTVTGYATPLVKNCHGSGVSYKGLYANEVEGFLGIRFAEDTSGVNRFKPPIPHVPAAHSAIEANEPRPACPQEVQKGGSSGLSLSLSPVTDISEDCLRLNVWRPNGTEA